MPIPAANAGAFFLIDGRTAPFREVASVGGQLKWAKDYGNSGNIPYGSTAAAIMASGRGLDAYGMDAIENITELVTHTQAVAWAQAWIASGFPNFTPPLSVLGPTFDPNARDTLVNDPDARERLEQGIDNATGGADITVGDPLAAIKSYAQANPVLWVGGAALGGWLLYRALFRKKQA